MVVLYLCFLFFWKFLPTKDGKYISVFSYIGKDHLFLWKEGNLFSRKLEKKYELKYRQQSICAKQSSLIPAF